MEQGRVADTAFAAAYARVADRGRAWIKTGLAAVYAACGGPMPVMRRDGGLLGHDLVLSRLDTPLDFALFVLGPDFTSPARLTAAVVPALCARVPDVAVLRVGASWPRALLTTLELCGVETACRLGSRALAGLWAELPRKGRGAVVVLGDVRLPPASAGGLRCLTAGVAGRAGVFSGPDAAFDPEALAFAHPDMTFFVHGPADALPSFAPVATGLAEAAELGYDAVYVGGDRLEAGLDAAPLALGPGRETFWFWPQLPPEVFRRRRVAAAVSREEG